MRDQSHAARTDRGLSTFALFPSIRFKPSARRPRVPGSLNRGPRAGGSSSTSQMKITWGGLSAWPFEPSPFARLHAGTPTRIRLRLSRECPYGRHGYVLEPSPFLTNEHNLYFVQKNQEVLCKKIRKGVYPYNSRVNFKAPLKVGSNQSTTLIVIYQNAGHTLKFMNLPGTSGHCWCGPRNPRWRPRWLPEINARERCI